jgi:hypothetical protein
MSPPEVWGPAIWTLFHTLAEKVNEQAYPFVKAQLFAQIRRICGFLPCPECSTHATIFLAKVNIDDLKTKTDFRNTFYLFHNMVNAKKRKPLFNYSYIESYNNYGIVPVINNFISKYNTKGNMKLLAESFQRKFIVNDFTSWFKKNILAFTPPQNVPSPISETIINDSVTEESTITSENAAVITEEVVVSEETVPTNETPVTEEVVATEETHATEEVDAEEFGISSEEVVTEEVVTEEVVSESVETVIQEVVTEELPVTEEIVNEELPVTEEEIKPVLEEEVKEEDKPKGKKGRKSKK